MVKVHQWICAWMIFSLFTYAQSTLANEAVLKESLPALIPINVQLKWFHQFQFAGFYAALDQGYFSQAGLDVTLIEGGPDIDPVDAVLDGTANFGIGNSSLLVDFNNGRPIVAVAAIFQHSPFVILARRDEGLRNINDLEGRKLMGATRHAELLTYLTLAGVQIDKIQLVPHTGTVKSLMEPQPSGVDATTAYISTGPYLATKEDIPHHIFSPRDININFYGDTLFTSRNFSELHPDRVIAMRKALIQGWQYALKYPDEIVSLILDKYQPNKDRLALGFESQVITQLLANDVVDIGFMSVNRWGQIGDAFVKSGSIKESYRLDGFLFKTEKTLPTYVYIVLLTGFLVISLVVLTTLYMLRINHRLRHSLVQIKESESQLSAHLHNTPLAAISWDRDFHVVRWNKAAEKMFGYTVDEAIGRHPTGFIVSDLLKTEIDQVYKALLENKGGWRNSNDNITKDDRTINCEWNNTTILDGTGKIIGVASLCEDVTARRQAELKIWEQAHYDSLTKLANRQMANDHLQQEIKIVDRSKKSLALLFLDLDGFKDINDTLGHDVGDNLLLEAAKRLSSYTQDVGTIARLGGDEFVIIMGGLDNASPAERIASDLLKKMAQPFKLGQDTVYISTSIGITLYPQDASDPIEMLRNADQAMYAAKHKGGNSFQYFKPSMQEGALSRMSMISDLRKALPGNQFQLYYQPIVNLINGDIHKAEALIRWQHPTKGLIGPFEFIPFAEETKLIVDIGDWVFREASRQSAQWRSSLNPDFQISINTSPVQYQNDAFNAKDWLEHLQTLKLSGDAIAVEITEGTLMEPGTSVDQILFDFRDANIQVSLDDFGTGYSSLSALKKLDIDYLKIDKLFVDNLALNSDNLALCEAIIIMAHKLGLKVIAEGIETVQQRDLLIAAGCDFGQGYLFAKPLPAIEFEALLKSR
jgi:diguanylate cyclase (GGDEF)-like protein/PAS domain S-box-containing protein